MKTIVQKKVVGGVALFQGKVLIMQRAKTEEIFPGLWEVPSGKREVLEPSEAALAREFLEETGLEVEVVKPILVFDYQIEIGEEIRDATQINFLVKLKSDQPEVKLSSEHQALAWIARDEIDNYNLTPITKKTIIRVFDLTKK